MMSVRAAAPPRPPGPATPPRSAPADQGQPVDPALQGLESAVWSPPPPVAPRSPPTTPTSGTRAIPAATPPPALELVPSPLTSPLMIFVS